MCEHAVERMPAVQNMSLIASGMPSSGPALPDAIRASDALAISVARSGVSNTNALSGRAFSIAKRYAAASSRTEKDFFFTPSPSSAKLNDVNSVTELARPPFVARVVPDSGPLLQRPARTQRTDPRRWHSCQRPFVPLRGRRPSPNIQVHRRCTLLHHLRHQEEVVFAHRRVLDDVFGNTAIGHNVGAPFHGHRSDRRHTFDPLYIHFAELIDRGQSTIQLALEMVDLLLGHGDTGEVRDAAYGIGVDSHGNSGTQQPSPAYSRASFIATTGSLPAAVFAAADQVLLQPISGSVGPLATRGRGPQPVRRTWEKSRPNPAPEPLHARAPTHRWRAEIPARCR